MEEYKTAESALKTTLFKWSADYISAAHYFDKAGEKFKIRGDDARALEAYSRAADAHFKAKQPVSAAKSMHLVAQLRLAQQQTNNSAETYGAFKQAYVDLMNRITVIHGENATAQRSAAIEFEAAQAFERIAQGLSAGEAKAKADANACALEFYKRCINKLVNSDRAVFSIDAFPAAVGFCAKQRNLAQALRFLEETLKVYAKLNQTRRKHQCYLTAVILHIARNDVVAARNAFSAHFDDAEYLRSRECEAAETLLTACENRDMEQIEKVVKGHVVNALHPPIAQLARTLYQPSSQPAAPSSKPKPKAAPKDIAVDMAKLSVAEVGSSAGEGEQEQAKDALFAKKSPAKAPTVPESTTAPAAAPVEVEVEEQALDEADGDDLDFLK